MTQPVPTVRYATQADEDALVALVQRMHADPEWGLRDWAGLPLKADTEKVRAIVQRATISNRNAPGAGGCWVGVVSLGDELLGSVCLRIQEPELSDGIHLEEVWSWVAPEHRRGVTAQLLLAFSLGLADEHQLTLVSAVRSYENGGRYRFMRRRIGSPVGSIFQYHAATQERVKP